MEGFKKYFSEFFGTACLVLFGCGALSITSTMTAASSGYLISALAFGIAFIAMEYTLGDISGCHLNPAVSLAMFINKKIDLIDLIGYVIFQVLGGVVGAGILFVIHGSSRTYGANTLTGVDGSIAKGLLMETLLTFVFVLVYLALKLKKDKPQITGVVIGLTLTLVNLIGIDLTNASVNPARSIGPAILAGSTALSQLWIFIVAPLAGGALAALVYKFLFAPKANASASEEAQTAEISDVDDADDPDEDGTDEDTSDKQ